MLLLGAVDGPELRALLGRFGLVLQVLACGEQIPGSYWGESEAGLRGAALYARPDTPLHSVLHEGAHFICMSSERRAGLDTDAGGDHAEENAVCYLQILLSGLLSAAGSEQMCRDMDDWGYTFRLGSAADWFQRDADDARDWLLAHRLIDAQMQPTYACR